MSRAVTDVRDFDGQRMSEPSMVVVEDRHLGAITATRTKHQHAKEN